MPTIHATNTVIFPNLPAAAADQQIALTASTRIVALLQQGTILAQHRLSKKQFRLLTLLLKLPVRELTETKHLFDDPDDRFDGAFASAIDGFAHGSLELVGHFDQGTRIIRWWSETLRPSGMMGITACGNVGFD